VKAPAFKPKEGIIEPYHNDFAAIEEYLELKVGQALSLKY
jgi:hypothetical protein